MDKIIPTLTIKPKKQRKVKKSNNIKLEFLNKPEPIKKPKTKGRGPDKQLRKLRGNKIFTLDEPIKFSIPEPKTVQKPKIAPINKN